MIRLKAEQLLDYFNCFKFEGDVLPVYRGNPDIKLQVQIDEVNRFLTWYQRFYIETQTKALNQLMYIPSEIYNSYINGIYVHGRPTGEIVFEKLVAWANLKEYSLVTAQGEGKHPVEIQGVYRDERIIDSSNRLYLINVSEEYWRGFPSNVNNLLVSHGLSPIVFEYLTEEEFMRLSFYYHLYTGNV